MNGDQRPSYFVSMTFINCQMRYLPLKKLPGSLICSVHPNNHNQKLWMIKSLINNQNTTIYVIPKDKKMQFKFQEMQHEELLITLRPHLIGVKDIINLLGWGDYRVILRTPTYDHNFNYNCIGIPYTSAYKCALKNQLIKYSKSYGTSTQLWL